ncbi:MAG: DUF2231 domain-containing protein [Alphaproteobacteria bacterium]|nr:DUF2231 domain-containing protein [Alphaproteobacteria bacterium]
MIFDLPIQIIPNWHAVIVHFPVALLITAAGLCVAARLLRGRPIADDLYKIAKWNLWLGTLAAICAVATGLYAFGTVKHDEGGHMAMLVHMHWALTTLMASVLASLVARFGKRSRSGSTGPIVALMLVTGMAVAVTGYLGGENVYRHGIGVIHLPNPDGHHHHDESLF